MLAHDLLSSSLPAVLSTSLDAIAVMRQDGTIAGWNSESERMLGWSWPQVQGRMLGDTIVPPEYREKHKRGLQQWRRTRQGAVLDRRIEVEALRADGQRVAIELAITPVETDWDPVFLGFMRDISARRAELAQKSWQVREMHHRVKNLLGVASSVASLTAANHSSVDRFTRVFTGRLQAMARGQEVLGECDWGPCGMAAVVAAGMQQHLSPDFMRVSVGGADFKLSARHTTAMVSLLHELAANASDYGALSYGAPHGTLTVNWGAVAGSCWLSWDEYGVPERVRQPKPGGGLQLIDAIVRHELRGKQERSWLPSGLSWRLTWQE